MTGDIHATADTQVCQSFKVAYLLKVFPRFSQTFVLNEILAHQAANSPVDIFSLRRPNDGRFHAALGQVQSPIYYFDELPKDAAAFLSALHHAASDVPGIWNVLQEETDASAETLYQSFHVARAIRSRGIQHIHAHFGNVASTVARLAARMAGISYSFTAHARDIFHDNVTQRDLDRKLRDAAGVVTVSQFNLDFLKEHYGASAAKVELVYNGLDLPTFSFLPSSGPAQHIVAVGRLVEKKGFRDLIHACEILVQNDHPNLRCTIAGGGPLQNELRAIIAAKKLQDVVKLVGPIPLEDVKQLVRDASLVVAPCVVADDGDRDGLPTILLESMALGTPCVGTPVTGIPEAIRHEETGLIANSNDPRSLAQACARLLNDASLRERVVRKARRQIEERFDVAKSTLALRERFQTWSATGSPITSEKELP